VQEQSLRRHVAGVFSVHIGEKIPLGLEKRREQKSFLCLRCSQRQLCLRLARDYRPSQRPLAPTSHRKTPQEGHYISSMDSRAKRRKSQKQQKTMNDSHQWGLHDYLGLRSVVRSHIIAWRKDMERRVWRRPRSGASSLHCPRFSIISANAMLSPATRWKG
jgi:hypothetical protein